MLEKFSCVQNAKAKIIHLLGGYTENDIDHKRTGWEQSLIDYGRRKAMADVKSYADSLYGSEKDEWIGKMYQYITDAYGRR